MSFIYVCFLFNDTATTESYTTDTLFPYTTLFRSSRGRGGARCQGDGARADRRDAAAGRLRPTRDRRAGEWAGLALGQGRREGAGNLGRRCAAAAEGGERGHGARAGKPHDEIGRASCRERVGKYV